MSIRKSHLLAVTVFCLVIGLLLVLSACEETYKYNVDFNYSYMQYPTDGTTEPYVIRTTGKLRTDEAEGNVLSIMGGKILPPDGYTFGGFKTFGNVKIFDEDLKQVSGVKLDKEIREIYPIWVPIEYTFLFAEREEDGKLFINEDKTFCLKTGQEFGGDVFYTPTPHKDNTEFIGWMGNIHSPDLIYHYTPENALFGAVGMVEKNGYFCHETSYMDQDGNTHTGDFIILRAVYDYIKHNVTLDYNTTGLEDVQIDVINNQSLPDLTKYNKKQNGKSIYGFSVSPTEYLPFTGVVTEPITLYAFWESYKTVTLHYSDTLTAPHEIYEISDNTLPIPKDADNYTFGGWLDGNGPNAIPVVNPSLNQAKDHYYAKWNGKVYSLSFHTGGGDPLNDGSYVYGEGTPLPTPEKYQNHFLGWCLDPELTTTPLLTMPLDASGHYTLYAKWEASRAISTKEELLAIADSPASGYYLTCDINLGGDTWSPIPVFTGTLEGNGFAIKNFSLKATNAADSYAFILENRGTITNITFKDMSVGYYNVKNAGVITAKNYGTIHNCHVLSKDTDLTAYALQYSYRYQTSDRSEKVSTWLLSGMIAGYNGKGGVISGCTASTPVSVTYHAQNTGDGGAGNVDMLLCIAEICGQNDGIIRGCEAAREISLTGYSYCDNGRYNTLLAGYLTIHSYLYLGGITGQNRGDATVEGCISHTSLQNAVEHRGNKDGYVFGAFGGIVGHNAGSISTCSAGGGTISGSFPHININKVGVGGVVGLNLGGGTVADCYAENMTTLVRNITTGGFVGTNFGIVQTSYVLNSELKVEVNDNDWYIGGFVGYNHTTANIVNCISRVTLNLPTANALYSRLFAGYTDGVMRSCYYSDGSTQILGGVTQTELIPDSFTAVKEDAGFFSRDFLIEELYWSEDVWQMDGENPPVLK